MIAVLARLHETDKTPFVESLLKDMMRKHMGLKEKELDEFVSRLGEAEDENTTPEQITSRISYFLGKVVKLVNIIEREFRLMRAFWRSA